MTGWPCVIVRTGSPGMIRNRKKLVTSTASRETAAPPSLPATYSRYAVALRVRGPDGPVLTGTGPSAAPSASGVVLAALMGYSRSSAVERRRRATKPPSPMTTTTATIPMTRPVDEPDDEDPSLLVGTADHQLQ